MIIHVVLFRLKDRSRANVERTVSKLAALRDKVPSLRSLEVGSDVIGSDRSYDVALIARFDDLAGLEAYRVHPEHVNVVEFIAGVKESTVAVDFEG